jgi:hypothetical protein
MALIGNYLVLSTKMMQIFYQSMSKHRHGWREGSKGGEVILGERVHTSVFFFSENISPLFDKEIGGKKFQV